MKRTLGGGQEGVVIVNTEMVLEPGMVVHACYPYIWEAEGWKIP